MGKQLEADANQRLDDAKRAFIASKMGCTEQHEGDDKQAQLDELEQRKCAAVEEENFALAAEIKKQQDQLKSGKAKQFEPAELDLIRRQKQEAIEKEDYASAAELRRRELELVKNSNKGGSKITMESDR